MKTKDKEYLFRNTNQEQYGEGFLRAVKSASIRMGRSTPAWLRTYENSEYYRRKHMDEIAKRGKVKEPVRIFGAEITFPERESPTPRSTPVPLINFANMPSPPALTPTATPVPARSTPVPLPMPQPSWPTPSGFSEYLEGQESGVNSLPSLR